MSGRPLLIASAVLTATVLLVGGLWRLPRGPATPADEAGAVRLELRKV